MTITDTPSGKADREHRDENCLHCMLMNTIEQYYRQHGERANGQVVIDVTQVVAKLAECTVEMTEMTRDRSQRRRAFRFAHDALDAQLKSVRSGKLIEVDIPGEH